MAFKIKNPHSFFHHHHFISATTIIIFIIIIIILNNSHQTTASRLITQQQPIANLITDSNTLGQWVQLKKSIGISAMHMQVMKDNKVVIFDRTDFGPSNISLPNHRCRFNPRDQALKLDCTAHSVLYDISSNTLRPLTLQTDAWCSSGSVSPTGTLIQTGGYNDGYNKLRTFNPCPESNNCDWEELHQNLSSSRWYASNQILPNGRIIVVGGRSAFSYEFVPKNFNDASHYFFRFLQITRDSNPGEENNLYPFLHLLPDGNLFIFANRRSILFDYDRNRVIREFPIIPGEEKRNYPSTGSSVMLPLNLTGKNSTSLIEVEIMVCGGAYPGAYDFANKKKVFLEASSSCGRLKVSDSEPEWVMEIMPIPRVMPDMILLPTGNLIILNGATNGTAGWENAVNPVLCPVLYRPNLPDPFLRFQLLAPASTPRLYHSSAVLLPDGRILVGGSNPHKLYDFRATYPTELSLDAYYPEYLGPEFVALRPNIIAVEVVKNTALHGSLFSVSFSLRKKSDFNGIRISMVAPSFTTHSFAMNQRVLFLEITGIEVVAVGQNSGEFGLENSTEEVASSIYKATVRGPPSFNVAPPGYYMLYVVHAGVPSVATWVHVD
ncbi:aldehyde oxidase GLOX-like [Trifolium pratense]|uniref:aldehyde oxidase GLOX-like n=1 Tax=Trifolium pratense TaxID=57577 RepID=UPI001E695CF4|nr:aldehyde oxidase GLOX-like [Trifolium pratense]